MRAVRTRAWTRARLALVAVAALASAGCGGVTVAGTGGGSVGGPSGDACGTVNLAVNPWVGDEADAAVYAYVAKTKLGCNVVKRNLTEQASWAGFGTGDVDLILENWGHEDLAQRYITVQKAAVDLGPNGNKGVIGWYVPPWLAAAHPDITDWKSLNKYAAQFATPASGGQGQLMDGDAAYATNDDALVKNLKLNFTVVKGSGETALIQSFRQAEAKKQFFLAYFYEPQWLFTELPLVKVNLPPRTASCAADAAKTACDYPTFTLNKVASTTFATSPNPAAELAKKFQWTNDDQNTVARSIAVDRLSDDDAAKSWVAANPDKVAAWLPAGTG